MLFLFQHVLLVVHNVLTTPRCQETPNVLIIRALPISFNTRTSAVDVSEKINEVEIYLATNFFYVVFEKYLVCVYDSLHGCPVLFY